MSKRVKKLLVAALFLAAAGLLLTPFLIRWSRPCDEERELARQAWSSYAAHLDAPVQAAAEAVLDQLDGDLDTALEQAEQTMPAPDDRRGGELYREAMERLALAQGACAGEP